MHCGVYVLEEVAKLLLKAYSDPVAFESVVNELEFVRYNISGVQHHVKMFFVYHSLLVLIDALLMQASSIRRSLSI
jgi:hypothetical protein